MRPTFAFLLVVGATTPLLAQPKPPQVIGLIKEKYDALGGAGGVLGKPLSNEAVAEDKRGRSQMFANGMIAWSPNCGPKCMTVAYVKDGKLHFEWGDTGPFHYDLFQVRYDRDGKNVGQDEVSPSRTKGTWSKGFTDAGRYRIVVQGGDRKAGGSQFKQGWTNAVYVDYRPPNPIDAHYRKLGGDKGILGKPLADEQDHSEGKGRYRRYQNGLIGWTPSVGPQALQTLYVKDGQIVLEWGDTKPFHYDFWQVRIDRDGKNLRQDEVGGSRTSGKWTFTPGDAGRYRVVVQGGDKSATGSKFKQGWSAPLYIDFQLPALIDEKYRAMGGERGVLGKPTGPEKTAADGRSRTRSYERGMIGFSPATGPRSLQVLYVKDYRVVLEWGTTAPFHYDFWQVRYDLNGVNRGQDELGSDRMTGKWSREFGRAGTYRVIVQGGDRKAIGGSQFKQGWSVPLEVKYVPAPTKTVMTDFKPEVHGFHFTNSFRNPVGIGELKITMKGRCGGMVYTALDYYHAKRTIPARTDTPGNDDPLAVALLDRQMDSFKDMLPKFAEKVAQQGAPRLPLKVGPGQSNSDMFRSGVDYIDGIVISIDKKKPLPLGLISIPISVDKNHQVLAIGYETSVERDCRRVYVYDPNNPNVITTLTPDPTQSLFRATTPTSSDTKDWRTLFSTDGYKPIAPRP